MVRGVNRRARRHVYAVGEWPAAELVGELGGLAPAAQEGSVPVWLSHDGRLVTERMAPRRRPAPRAVGDWVLEPWSWEDARAPRVRAIARRLVISLRMLAQAYPRAERPAGEPIGHLLAGGPATLALYGALHPVTGDQLLATSVTEAERLGYAHVTLLGHLAAVAPVTGVLGAAHIDLAWAARSRDQAKAREPQGAIDGPRAGEAVPRDAFVVSGWALWPAAPVARVEIALDGEPAGRARIGLPRPDVASRAEQLGRPGAWICGFEFRAAPAELPADAAEVRVDAVAVRTDGERFALPAATVALVAPRSPVADADVRAASLRARVQHVIGRAPKTAPDGLRILAFTHHLGYGGSQRYFFELLRRLAADPAVSCTVVAPGAGPYGVEIESLGLPVHVTNGFAGSDADVYEGRMLELAAWAAPQSFDLVWVNSLDSYQGADLAGRLGVPVVWSIHESFDVAVWWATVHGSADAWPYARRRAEAALRAAHAVVFPADATRQQYERYCAPGRMVTIPYGVELDEIARYRDRFDAAAARERRGIAPDATVVLSLGTVEPRKGQTLVAQAFAEICDRHPGAQLVLVGDQPNLYSTGLHGYLGRTTLEGRIHTVPLVADPYEWHGIADVLVLASDVESSPIVILEAMAFQTPVVATAVFGVPELIEDGVNGYLCEPCDVASLAAALERALGAGAESRRAVGVAGERRVRERHDPLRHEQRMRALIGAVAADPAALPAEPRPAAPGRAGRSVSERVSVLIPTRDAGDGFERSLDAIWAQEGLGGLEIVVADSGSADDTVEVARRAGARVQRIPQSEFNHGATRNLLAGLAGGDVLLTTVQDARLIEPTALLELVQELCQRPRLAAISASQTAGEGADLFSLWHAWLHLERPREDASRAVDNVCAAIRRSAWEQLHFRELDFAEDLDFGLRAHAAGWTTAFSPSPLAAHHHDRPADHALARAAAHRYYLAALRNGVERDPTAAPGLGAILAAVPTVVGQVQASIERAAPATTTSLARFLSRVRDGLHDDLAAAQPTGELALLCALCAANGQGDGAAQTLRGRVLAALQSPWLAQFALAQIEPIDRREAEAFVARFVGTTLGQVLGDAMRDVPDSDVAGRVRALAVNGTRLAQG